MLNKKFVKKNIAKGFSILKKNKPVSLTVIIFAVISDIFFISGNSDPRIFGILAFYAGCIWIYKLKNSFTFILLLGLLVVMFLAFVFSGPSEPTEKAAVWLVLFLAIGIVQQWRE